MWCLQSKHTRGGRKPHQNLGPTHKARPRLHHLTKSKKKNSQCLTTRPSHPAQTISCSFTAKESTKPPNIDDSSLSSDIDLKPLDISRNASIIAKHVCRSSFHAWRHLSRTPLRVSDGLLTKAHSPSFIFQYTSDDLDVTPRF